MIANRLKSSVWIFDVGLWHKDADVAPGWMPEAGVFSALGLAMMAAFEFGVPLKWPLTIIGIVDLLATQHFMRGLLRRIRRLGWFRPRSARWWIELAALDWTLVFSAGVFGLTHGAGAALPPWQQVLVVFARRCVAYSFPLFFVLTMVGYAVGLIRGRRIRGRSLELVNWFFWSMVVLAASFLLVPAVGLVAWVAPALFVSSVIVLVAAGVLALGRRMRQAGCQVHACRSRVAGTSGSLLRSKTQ